VMSCFSSDSRFPRWNPMSPAPRIRISMVVSASGSITPGLLDS
jgi:hypothetical protein